MTIEVTKVDQINCEPNSLMISPLIQSDSSTYVEPHISVVLGTEKVTNRFRGLDLIDRVPEELWTEVHDIVQETDQDHHQEKEMQKSKMAV